MISILTLDGERLARWGDGPINRSCNGIWVDSHHDQASSILIRRSHRSGIWVVAASVVRAKLPPFRPISNRRLVRPRRRVAVTRGFQRREEKKSYDPRHLRRGDHGRQCGDRWIPPP